MQKVTHASLCVINQCVKALLHSAKTEDADRHGAAPEHDGHGGALQGCSGVVLATDVKQLILFCFFLWSTVPGLTRWAVRGAGHGCN
eukprot:scaffold80571_cov22-Tisochrysis_lutea.AAC.4